MTRRKWYHGQVQSGRFNFDEVLEVLKQAGLLGDPQAEELVANQSAQRYRLTRRGGASRGGALSDITAVELLASFQLDGLSEDRIMEALAEHASLPYEKIDPLKLDTQLITSTLSRPFATKHRLLPLSKSNGCLRLATDDPFNIDAIEMVRNLCRSITASTVKI